MKNKKITVLFTVIILLLVCAFLLLSFKKDNLTIDIGYQSVTSETWGALIIKNKNIFEDKLKNYYKDKKVKVIWHDEISGSVINTNMISGKIQIGFMGDMPLLLNMYKSSTLKDYSSNLIAIDGRGENGKNQSIVIPKNSNIKKIEDLEGKTISTPIGSSAHYMLMKVLEKNNLLDKVKIVHQDVALATQLLSTNKTDAFSIWEPYPTFFTKEEIGKVLVSGEASDIDYLAGVIVNSTWANKNKKIVELFLESLDEAHQFMDKNKKEATKICSMESGFSSNVVEEVLNNINWDSDIKEEDINTLEDKQEFLIKLDQINKFNLRKFIYKRGE